MRTGESAGDPAEGTRRMDEPSYLGIKYPDRAESLRESEFSEYRTFLEHWDTLGERLRFMYEGLALRGDTRALIVHGDQGSGKTMLAGRLSGDFRERQKNSGAYDEQNLWDRITGGARNSALATAHATEKTSILSIEDDKNWVTTAEQWKANNTDRHCVLIVDNAERGYFVQGLLRMNDQEFASVSDEDRAFRLATERLVALARGTLRRCLFLLLTNNDAFALRLEDGVNAQHQNLATIATLPFPSNRDKETVIRTNINRLNPISYWYCIDKAGPEGKSEVYKAITGQVTYPGAFAAVDAAIKTATLARVGRPASKCLLSLVLLHPTGAPFGGVAEMGVVREDRSWDLGWLTITTFDGKWAGPCLGDETAGRLLESEWNLRVITLSDEFVSELLKATDSTSVCASLMEALGVTHGPGTWAGTIAKYLESTQELMGQFPALDADSLRTFWGKGQGRSRDYEDAMRRIWSGYNQRGSGFLAYRPDLVVEDYVPCSVVEAVSSDHEAVSAAIRRRTHALEVTAQQSPTLASVQGYLATKLPNYVRVMKDQ